MASGEKTFHPGNTTFHPGNESKAGQRRRKKKPSARQMEEDGGRNGSNPNPPHPVDNPQGPPADTSGQNQGMSFPPQRQQGGEDMGNPQGQNDGGKAGWQKKGKNKARKELKQQQKQQSQQQKQEKPQNPQQQSKQQQKAQQQQPQSKGNTHQSSKGQQGNQTGDTSRKNSSGKSGSHEDYEEKVDNAILREMEKQKIFPLKKKSIKFPRAKFFCRLCEYHLDRVQDYRKHVSEPRHKRRKEVTDSENTLRYMPAPTEKQVQALDLIVETIYKDYGLTQAEIEQREAVVKRVEEFIHKKIPGVSLHMYGSSLTGFGLKSSDINIDFFSADIPSLPKLLTEVFNLLKTAEEKFVNVHSDFSAKMPAIVFNDPGTKLECKLTINSRPATATSQLLAVYNDIDPRVSKLAVAFRYWAKVCRLDVQCEGTLPAYATSLMTVFFLQHLPNPVLPVLCQHLPKNVENDASVSWIDKVKEEIKAWETENTSSVGSLWLDTLRYFSLGFDTAKYVVCLRQHKMLPRAEKKWNSKKLAIEDPFSQKRNVARTVSNTKIYEYFQDSLRKAYHYFGLPRSKNGQSLISNDMLSTIVEKSRGKRSLSDLSPDLEDTDDNTDAARDSSVEPEHDLSETSCGESSPERQVSDTFQSSSVEGQSSVSMLCEEDSSIISASISSIVTDHVTDEVGVTKCKDVYEFAREFALKVVDSAMRELTSSSESVTAVSGENSSESVTAVSGESSVSVSGESVVEGSVTTDESPADVSASSSEVTASNVDQTDSVEGSGPCDVEREEVKKTEESSEGETTTVIKCDETITEDKSTPALNAVEELLKELHLEDKEYFYEFSEKILTDGKGPAIICGYCEKEGHLKSSCPEDKLPKLIALPQLKKPFIKMLSVTVEQVPRDFGPTRDELEQREYILYELEEFIRQLFPAAKLQLFGSSCNGFGFRMSDLDICMTFTSQKTAKDIKCAEIIERLAKKLKEHKGLYQVVAIPTAKVPIVKFRHRHSQLEGDISLYNTLAQHNTQLLLAYSRVDPRVQALGYAFKVFAKVCDIGDASRGSLSSYAYVLMLLHYLQQCRPPVIPVLQEIYHGKKKPERMVDDCNAYFFENLDDLHKVWKEYGRNKSSVGELWLGLFRYYTEEFNYKEMVVSIKQKAPLSRFEKLWNGKCLAIEDPFDLNHNLGAGLSRKMNNYILKAFIHGRELYGVTVEEPRVRQVYRSLGDYFFDRSLLTEGTPPNDRGCRVCGKIGHIAKECPIVTNRKEREERERRQREERNNMNRMNEQMAKQNTMSPNAHQSKSHSSPNTPGAGHMSQPSFREKPHRSKSMPEESHSKGANSQMSPQGYRTAPVIYNQHQHPHQHQHQHQHQHHHQMQQQHHQQNQHHHQQMYMQPQKSSPRPIPLIRGNPISPVSPRRPDHMARSPHQVAPHPHGSPSGLSMRHMHGQNNYMLANTPLSQVLNVSGAPGPPPTPGQQIMMAISPQKGGGGGGGGMGHHQMMPSGAYPYSQPMPSSQMHSPPQHMYGQAPPFNLNTHRQVTQTNQQPGASPVLNITVSNDHYQNYGHHQ